MRRGLRRRTMAASGLLAAVVAATFALLLVSVADVRESARLATESQGVLRAGNDLERLLVDMERGLRGFLLTGQDRFLRTWQRARDAFPERGRALERLVGGHPAQRDRVRRILVAGTSYIRDYSAPLVDDARRGVSVSHVSRITSEGARRLDSIRQRLDRLLAVEGALVQRRQDRADTSTNRAVIVAAAGIGVVLLLVVLFGAYLGRAIVRPVSQAAAMATRIAGGNLRARMPETALGEIGELERSFNTMAASLEATTAENVRAREDLARSRARVVAAGDEARRRIERNLHDGAQQRLVSLGLELRAAQTMIPDDLVEARQELGRVVHGLEGVLEDLREISRGIHPAILSTGGLGPALRALGRRSALPVETDVRVDRRLPEPIEVGAYYIVSEALANAVKHARASLAHVDAEVKDGLLRISVRDDGVGGADPARGSGILGLRDRAEALGGTLDVISPPGAGTRVVVGLPIAQGGPWGARPASDPG